MQARQRRSRCGPRPHMTTKSVRSIVKQEDNKRDDRSRLLKAKPCDILPAVQLTPKSNLVCRWQLVKFELSNFPILAFWFFLFRICFAFNFRFVHYTSDVFVCMFQLYRLLIKVSLSIRSTVKVFSTLP